MDVDNITNKLPDPFKVGGSIYLCSNTYMTLYTLNIVLLPLPRKHTQVPLEKNLQKRLEYEFHSASYHTIMEVITGLRTVAGHLLKVPPAVTLCK